jgi:hypothetical protein
MTTVSDGDDPLNAAAARLELQLRGLGSAALSWFSDVKRGVSWDVQANSADAAP